LDSSIGTILDDDDLDYLNINLNESNIEDAKNNISTKRGGKKKDKVWEYFNIVDISNSSHKGAICKFCLASWKRRKPNEMKSHLALRCTKVTYNVKIEYLHAISLNEDSSSIQSTTNVNYKKNDNNILDFAKAHKALTRFFVCCEIPFQL
jgi:hypothetical protein